MTDEEDKVLALEQLARLVQLDVVPVVQVWEAEEILESYKRASRWVTVAELDYGALVMPTDRNGHLYRVTTGGTGGVTEPASWTTTDGGIVADGDVEMEEAGPDMATVYDVRGAAQACWGLKARRASQFIDAGDLKLSQVVQHCIDQMRSLGSVRIA